MPPATPAAVCVDGEYWCKKVAKWATGREAGEGLLCDKGRGGVWVGGVGREGRGGGGGKGWVATGCRGYLFYHSQVRIRLLSQSR